MHLVSAKTEREGTMILVSRLRLGVIRARAQAIVDYADDAAIPIIAQNIVKEVTNIIDEEQKMWEESIERTRKVS